MIYGKTHKEAIYSIAAITINDDYDGSIYNEHGSPTGS